MSNGAFRVTAAPADIACGAPPEGTFRRRRAALIPCSTPPLPSLPGRASCEWGTRSRLSGRTRYDPAVDLATR